MAYGLGYAWEGGFHGQNRQEGRQAGKEGRKVRLLTYLLAYHGVNKSKKKNKKERKKRVSCVLSSRCSAWENKREISEGRETKVDDGN